jgi:hypothetical protein
MFSKRMSRVAQAALIVTLCLAPSVAQAGVRPGVRKSKPAASRVQERGGVFQSFWHGLVGLFEKNGNSIDPSGTPVPGTGSGAGTDNGPGIDPSGTPKG